MTAPQSIKLLIVAGARPNFMKVAPIIRAAHEFNAKSTNGTPRFHPVLVHSGQHYDPQMSDIFFKDLGIPNPDANLGVGSGSHAVQTANVMLQFEPVCEREKPDWVVVVGDINSTLACTLVAVKMGIRVAHVEAGLRSYDRTMPEETNRIVTDSISDLLLTPSEDANENLMREGIPDSRIRLVGNVMIDSVLNHLELNRGGGILDKLGLEAGEFIYVTLHRPSNVDCSESLRVIVDELSAIADDHTVVFPIHPRTRKKLSDFGLSFKNGSKIKLIEPVGYDDSLGLTRHARCILTDSGGLQEESTYFRTPCLTLRPNTERPITISLGSNRLTSVSRLQGDLAEALAGPARLGTVPPLWDGRAAERILEELRRG